MDLTPEQKKARIEQIIANEDVLKAIGLLDDPDLTKDQRATLTRNLGKLVGLDLMAEFEKHEAKLTEFDKNIAAMGAARFPVPGAEDEFDWRNPRKRFNTVGAWIATAKGGKREHFAAMGCEREFEFLKAFWDNHGDAVQHSEYRRKAQQVGDDELGGYYVPDQMHPQAIRRAYQTSKFIALDPATGETRCTLLNGLVGDPYRFQKEFGGVVMYWNAEGQEATESQITSGIAEMRRRKATILLSMTEEQLEFAAPGFFDHMDRAISWAFANGLDTVVPYGDGQGGAPTGIVKTPGVRVMSAQSKGIGSIGDALGTTPFQADWQGGEFSWDLMMKFQDELEDVEDLGGNSYSMGVNPDLDISVVTSGRFVTRRRQDKIENYSAQTSGNPYLLGFPFLSIEQLNSSTGYDFAKTVTIGSKKLPGASIGAPTTSTTAKHTDVFFGDLSQVYVGTWGGIDLRDDGGTGVDFKKGVTWLRGKVYLDVHVVRPSAVGIVPDAKARD